MKKSELRQIIRETKDEIDAELAKGRAGQSFDTKKVLDKTKLSGTQREFKVGETIIYSSRFGGEAKGKIVSFHDFKDGKGIYARIEQAPNMFTYKKITDLKKNKK